jgi:hypothetical protein
MQNNPQRPRPQPVKRPAGQQNRASNKTRKPTPPRWWTRWRQRVAVLVVGIMLGLGAAHLTMDDLARLATVASTMSTIAKTTKRVSKALEEPAAKPPPRRHRR